MPVSAHANRGPHGSAAGIAALAQSVEHIIRNDGVTCSSHVSGTILSSINQIVIKGRAPPSALQFIAVTPRSQHEVLQWRPSVGAMESIRCRSAFRAAPHSPRHTAASKTQRLGHSSRRLRPSKSACPPIPAPPEPDPVDVMKPFPAGLMKMWPVGRNVGLPRNDTPDVLTRLIQIQNQQWSGWPQMGGIAGPKPQDRERSSGVASEELSFSPSGIRDFVLYRMLGPRCALFKPHRSVCHAGTLAIPEIIETSF